MRPRLSHPRPWPIPLAAVLAAGLLWLGSAPLPLGQAPTPALAQSPAQPRVWERQEVRRPGFDITALLDPRGVAAAPGSRFYVADQGHDRIVVLDAAGDLVAAFGERGDGPAELDGPTDVAVDSARDRVFVADYGNRRLSIFNLAGTPIARWRVAGPQDAFVPYAVAVSPTSGDVIVLSRLPWGRIERFTADGQWVTGWGSIGGGAGQFRSPEDLTVDGSGRILVADTLNSRVEVFAPDGSHLADWRDVPGVRDVAVDPTSGEVHALAGGDEVRVFLSSGTPVRTLRSSALAQGFSMAERLAVATAGRLGFTTGYNAGDGRHGLRQYDAQGNLLAASLADPLGYPGFAEPLAMATGPDGSLYLTDARPSVTRRYTADGTFAERFDAGAGNEIAVATTGDIYVADTRTSGAARVRRIFRDGRAPRDWSSEAFSGIGLAADGERLFATLAISRAVGVYRLDQPGNNPTSRLLIPDPTYGWPYDLALGPDGRLHVAGGEGGRLDVYESGGTLMGGWRAPGGNGFERVSVGPDGTVFTLLLDGSLAAYTPGGVLEAGWWPEPAPGESAVAPLDIAAGPGGRLYVLDEPSRAVFVYDPRSATVASPTPTTTPAAPCTVSGTKTAAPGVVPLGQPVTVTLTLDIRCPAGSETSADVMLVLDRSNSMAGEKLSDAKAAAAAFVNGLDLARHRVGLVSFSDVVSLDQALTDDAPTALAAIAAVKAHGTTNIAGALDRANTHLAAAARPGALGVILLLTDGEPTVGGKQGYIDTARHAARARTRGTLVYAIGLGANVDTNLLEVVAGSPDRYFFAPEASDLAPIYRRLSESVGAVVASDVQVIDELGMEMEFVPGSASGRPAETGRRVVWNLGAIPAGGITPLTLRVLPLTTGRLPTNTQAVAQYTAGGARYSHVYPIPEVQVVDRATSTPTPTATPTPTPTRPPTGPSTVYLPILNLGVHCPKDRRRPADVMLVLDTSSSMTGAKLAQAVAAAKSFVDLVNPAQDRVGVVSFNSTARRLALTSDLGAVRRELDGLSVAEGTRIDLGLYEALSEFYYRARPGVARVVVVVTDGQPMTGTREQTLEQADLLRGYGVTVYVIGLGADADGAFLRQLAEEPSRYYFAPTAADLAAIYDRIAVHLPCG